MTPKKKMRRHAPITLLLLLAWLCFPAGLRAATNVSGTISANTTWTLANSPYIVTSSVTVLGSTSAGATLTIEPGVVVKFNSGCSINIGASSGNPGALIAQGTSANPITFTSNQTTPTAGYWNTIMFNNTTNDATTVLDYCTIQYAGYNNSGALWVYQAAPTIRNITIANSSSYGVNTYASSPIINGCQFNANGNYDLYYTGTLGGSITNCTIRNGISLQGTGSISFAGNSLIQNNTYPIKAYADNVGAIVNGCTFTNVNSTSYLDITSGNLTKDATWTAAIPYVVRNSMIVQGTDGADGITTLRIAAGAKLKFCSGQYLQVGANSGAPGALMAEGTPNAPIVFTSNQSTPAPGDWYGIKFWNTTADALSFLQYCTIEYAGLQGGTVWIDSAAPALDHCEIRNGKNYDLYYSGATIGGSVENCTINRGINLQVNGQVRFTDNTINYNDSCPIIANADQVGGIVNGATFINVDAGSNIQVTQGSITKDAVWKAGISYVIPASIIIQGTDGDDGVTTLTLSAGAILKFGAGLYLQIGAASGAPGALRAEGSAGAPILFTSSKTTPVAGDWYGLRFLNTTADATTLLQNCRVQYAGFAGYGAQCSVLVDNSAPAIRNCIFDTGLGYDLVYSGTVAGSIENCTISRGINLYADGLVSLSGNTINYNNNFPIKIYADNVHGLVNSSTFTNLDAASRIEVVSGNITKDAVWTSVIPYLIKANPKIQGTDGADGITSLTIMPGARLKFDYSASLKVGDTAGAPGALFAQGAKDNMILFTSNQPSPAPGNWSGIHFYPTTQPGSLLDFCVIEYGGANMGGGYSGAVCFGSNIIVRNSTIRNCANYGLQINGAAASAATIQCNTFQQNSFGLYIGATAPAIQSSNFLNNTTYGLYNGLTSQVVAENNWWGDTAGPNKSGDKIHGTVDYDPWATALILCDTGSNNHAPYTPAGPQPADNAVRVTIPSSGLILTWSGGDPDPLDTVTYSLYRGSSADNLSLMAINLAGTTYTMTDLQRGVTYFWKVVARDNHGLQAEGPIWRFTALGDNPDLIIGGLTTTPPGHLQSGQIVTLIAQLRNIGSGPVVDPFNVSFAAGGTTIGTPTVNTVIPAGTSLSVSQNWTYTGGDPSLQVMADSQHTVSETNEQNNNFIALLSEVADNTPPALVSTSPVNTSYLKQAQQISATLSDSQSAIDINTVLAGFTVTNAQNAILSGAKSQANGTFTFTPAILPMTDSTYTVTLTAADVLGNTKVYYFTFTIDTQPPAKPVITGGTVTSGTIQAR
ncbi:MAG: right-handed parallel beta-helix repeat-containing protein, partial [Desulfobacteraceae bacterium]|nr:right-handed parallel beta-helix repeat-containing protein [Desulfobacteraceae bacterium]